MKSFTENTKPQNEVRIGAANIGHVAKLAGVSTATASRAFSTPSIVTLETAERIFKAAKRLNYTPNPLARGLRGGKTETIGILWSFGGSPTVAEFTRDIVMRVQKHGYIANISDHGSDPQITRKLIENYTVRGIDGLVFQFAMDNSGYIKEYLDNFAKIKAVLIVTAEYLPVEYDQIIIDGLGAYRASARHFIETGRKNIGLVIPHRVNKEKAQAFADEVTRHGLAFVPQNNLVDLNYTKNWISELHSTLESKYANKPFPFDALMCSSDEIAMATMLWLREKGVRTPDDVAIIGYNNSIPCEFQYPPLASCDRHILKMSETIEKMLFERIENPKLPPRTVEMPIEFVWRKSAG
jgi:LacI family transcriptional regulator